MISESMKISGEVSLVLTGPDGKVKQEITRPNLVVTTGTAFIASRMEGTDDAVMSHMAIGSGTTTAAASDTDVESVLGVREAIDTAVATNNQIVYTCGFEAGDGTGAVTEAGIFNASTGGSMLCRTVFPVVNKQADDVLTITWTITISAS
jgi:hypothetical protein